MAVVVYFAGWLLNILMISHTVRSADFCKVLWASGRSFCRELLWPLIKAPLPEARDLKARMQIAFARKSSRYTQWWLQALGIILLTYTFVYSTLATCIYSYNIGCLFAISNFLTFSQYFTNWKMYLIIVF